MDNLQYNKVLNVPSDINHFKPYYKWITFNTKENGKYPNSYKPLNFKPYYKWITFNTSPQFRLKGGFYEF